MEHGSDNLFLFRFWKTKPYFSVRSAVAACIYGSSGRRAHARFENGGAAGISASSYVIRGSHGLPEPRNNQDEGAKQPLCQGLQRRTSSAWVSTALFLCIPQTGLYVKGKEYLKIWVGFTYVYAVIYTCSIF